MTTGLFNEVIGTSANDVLVAQPLDLIYGLEGDDFLSTETVDLIPSGFVGGSGSDTYTVRGTGLIIETGNSTNDTLIAEGIGLFRETSEGFTIDGRHLVAFDETTEQGFIIIDWQQPQSRIENFILADGQFSYQEIVAAIDNLGGLENFTIDEIFNIGQEFIDLLGLIEPSGSNLSQRFNDALSTIMARSEELERGDQPPVVANPLSDINVNEDAANQTIDLSNVFIDPDNDTITLEIVNNSNSGLVRPLVQGTDLTLDFLNNQFGIANITIRATANEQSIEDTFSVTVNGVNDPGDDPPVVAQPIADITVKENVTNQTIELSDVFQDIDSSTIELEVINNTNSNLVTPLLEGDDLTLDFLGNQSGTAEITIRATADGQSVEDTFTLTVNPIFDTPINRFQNTDISGTYLFAGEEESKNIRANFPNFFEEGFAFNVASQPGANLQALYRFQSLITPGTYLFAGEQERISINENFADAFREEGLAFYVYGAGTGLGEEFIRFQNSDRPGTYLFAGEQEAKSIRANFPNFMEEGAAFEVLI
ncbi:MAG: hypothetical protein QNJ60_20120 [Xenococcaceae cyanobacterium MO_188.B19]|nr:hypothetical protein [Xenococcaceae cyanobacterium MO_188.B19]